MTSLIRSLDWSNMPRGPVESWQPAHDGQPVPRIEFPRQHHLETAEHADLQ
jgi:hypothetical protein